MNPSFLLMLASFLVILAVLAVDLFFYRHKNTIYMTNQSHVNLYVVPFLLSFVLFTLAISGEGMTPLGLGMLLIFLGVYIYILTYDKIILIGAAKTEVIAELEAYLRDSGRSFRVYSTNEFTSMVEINNYRNALIVRDADKWIEIDNHIHYDEDFIRALNDYFREKAPAMEKKRVRPNIFFYVLILVIAILAFSLSKFYLTV